MRPLLSALVEDVLILGNPGSPILENALIANLLTGIRIQVALNVRDVGIYGSPIRRITLPAQNVSQTFGTNLNEYNSK